MATSTALPANFTVERGQTQIGVNRTILTQLINRFPADAPLNALDLPCGNLEFLTYVGQLFPAATLCGADIVPPASSSPRISFVKTDLTRDFQLPEAQKFDLITSISGVMMFGNTLSFIQNCVAHLKPGGTFVLTNDNSATIIDRLAYLFLGRYRIFRPLFEDTDPMTQIIPLPELVRLLRTHGIDIERIDYTSSYRKDLRYLPLALLVHPIQQLYLRRIKTRLPTSLTQQMYPFKALFCKHYIITGRKIS